MDYSKFIETQDSKSAKDTYARSITRFLHIHNSDSQSTPYELSNKYFNDRSSLPKDDRTRKFKDDLEDYKLTLKNLAPKSQLTYIAAVIRFLEDCGDAEFGDSFKRRIYKMEKGSEAINEEYVPSNIDIARIIEFMPLNARTLTLVLSSSGMRVGEALSLRISEIELDKNPVRIHLKAKNTKTKKKRITFISSEAKGVLQEWLTYRSKKFPDDDRIFPFSQSNYEQIWSLSVKKAGLDKRNEPGNNRQRLMLRIHNLRKFFRTYGRWSLPDCAEALLGHTSGLEAVYTRMDQAENILEEEYLRCEPNLSIYEQSKTVTELKQKVEKQSDDIQQLVVNLSVRNAKLENEIVEIKKMHEQHTSELQKMQDFVMREVQDQFETITMGYKLQLDPHALDVDEERE